MKGIYVRQIVPAKKDKVDLFFKPGKRSLVSLADPRWLPGEKYYELVENYRQVSMSSGNFAYSCIEYPLVSAGTKGSYLGSFSRFLHVNFGIAGSILSSVALHTAKWQFFGSWEVTYALSAGVFCTFSYCLEYINRNSYNIQSSVGERKDTRVDDDGESGAGLDALRADGFGERRRARDRYVRIWRRLERGGERRAQQASQAAGEHGEHGSVLHEERLLLPVFLAWQLRLLA